MTKNEIFEKLENMKTQNLKRIKKLSKKAALTDYRIYAKKGGDIEIWTDAFQTAINENEILFIPKRNAPYYIDKTVTIPSDRHIEAEDGAIIKQAEGVTVLMLKNENTVDGTHFPIKNQKKDCNISINGGRWEESYTKRMGYRKSGKYDEDETHFFGVSTFMLFNNVSDLTLTNMTFAHTAGFSVQVGELENAVFENITFHECYADGLHINGNTKNILIRNIKGQVGDDLVALNMYDWQNSSVNFGPGENILCENIELSENSSYTAMRIEPGMYYFDNGEAVDCALKNALIRNIKGVKTFKMYFQTFPYIIGEEPEKGGAGSIDNVYFENIDIDLDSPEDKFPEYLNSDPVRGNFAAFEIGSKVGKISFSNINITLHKDKFPMSYFLTVGPKSIPNVYENTTYEIFDPYISSCIEELHLEKVLLNGQTDWQKCFGIKEIEYFDINHDSNSTANGKIKKIIYD